MTRSRHLAKHQDSASIHPLLAVSVVPHPCPCQVVCPQAPGGWQKPQMLSSLAFPRTMSCPLWLPSQYFQHYGFSQLMDRSQIRTNFFFLLQSFTGSLPCILVSPAYILFFLCSQGRELFTSSPEGNNCLGWYCGSVGEAAL